MVPESDVDLFADEALLEPYGHYRALRDLGPVVRLGRHDVLAVPRYAEARQVLADPETFCSGQGVGLNVFINEGGRGTTLMSDGDAHRRQRAVIGQPLTPKAMAALRPDVQALADALVDRLVARGSFDAVADLAEVIPSTWVPDLLGLPADGRDRLLSWGSASFDGLGPLNGRCEAAGERLIEMTGYAIDVVARREFPAGSMAAGILAAADRGEIDAAQCPQLVIDYLGPSLDTTISAIGNAVWCFATHPEQWDALRRDPGRMQPAFNEVMRYESPVNGFSRVATPRHGGGRCRHPGGHAGARPPRFARTATSAGGTGPTSSTSGATAPASSGSVTACTSASAWAWLGSRAPRCCRRWRRGSSASRSASPCASSTT